MEENSRKRKKSAITEDDISTLLLRYSVRTVLTLLHEVVEVAGEKIDWNEIVKNTASGIPSAIECRMLWRHLAYGESLTDQFDTAANPMDDDSDLEHEMEAIPAVNREASVEAAAYVKVLLASNYPIGSHVPNNWTIEAPLNINIPKLKVPLDRPLLANAMVSTNVSIPVSVQKEKLSSGTCGEKRPKDGRSGVDSAPQRKRKIWSTEDDVKLTAAVQKHGDQNWANVASEDFSNDRKATELSQRWANIKKKKGTLNAGTSSEFFEARKAASRAILIALEPDHLKATPQMSNGTKSQHKSPIASALPSGPQSGIVVPPKSRVPTESPSTNYTTSPNPMVQAAAVAAGARIVTPTGTSSVIEAAARSSNVVHIRTGVGSSTSMVKQLPSSHNGPTKTAISTCSTTIPSLRHGEAQIAQDNSTKPAGFAVRPPNPVSSARVLDVSSATAKATASLPNIEGSIREMKKVAERERGTVELGSEGQSSNIGNQRVDDHLTPTIGKEHSGR